MPPTAKTLKKYVCEIPDCPGDGKGHKPAAYELPQHLGVHLRHTHGIKGERHKVKVKAKATTTPAVTRRAPTPKHIPLSAADICAVVLKDIAPKGSIPIDLIDPYNEWVRQTEAFLGKLLG